MVDNLLYQANKLETADATSFATAAYKKRNPNYGVVTFSTEQCR